ncbi:phage head-tail connector protein [Shouchella clausii]|uniref:phage head-tail connector protein n=1 Tax=Shouchella clausii TaxID=79880 RepID=UPI000BA6643D|nr:phage head-tail connector protein [Shouchella clausii]PAE96771.1 hypothetical protein CHH71_12235 [Shouchella clausii]
MELNDLKRRLSLAEDDTSKDDFLQVMLSDAIEMAQDYCNQDFMVDGQLKLPGGVKMAIVKLVKLAQTKPNLQSRSISGGVSETYFTADDLAVIKGDLAPYVKAVFC